MSNANSNRVSDFHLRVFQEEAPPIDNAIFQQQPVVSVLTEQFEQVTGWKLEFVESRASHQRRELIDSEYSAFGELEITDLSEQIEAGKSARHRGYCEKLVETLDLMIKTIQLDRQRFREISTQLNPVVQPPFDWWGLAGNSGLANNRIATWTVSQDEKIRIFNAQLESDEPIEAALAGSALLATFQIASRLLSSIDDIAPLLPLVNQSQSMVKLANFSTIELDPITGEYEIDGFNAVDSYALLDVQAGGVIRGNIDDNAGILYSGQVMAFGFDNQDIASCNELIGSRELTTEHSLSILKKAFCNSASIFLYRK